MHLKSYNNDEISIVDLLKFFWRQKVIILTVTLVSFCLCLAYLFNTTPSYDAFTFISPPRDLDLSLSELNAAVSHGSGGASLKKYSTSDLYSTYIQSLLSEMNKQNFFEKIYLPFLSSSRESSDITYSSFLKALKIKQDPVTKSSYKVIVTSFSKENAKKLLSIYIDRIQKNFIQNVKKDLSYQINAELEHIKLEMKYLEQLSKSLIMNKISFLKIALEEAKTGKINYSLVDSINDGHFETFMLGTKILNTRIAVLKGQKISPSLMKKYSRLEADKKFYEVVAEQSSRIHFNALNSAINTAEFTTSLSKHLILTLGLILGLMLGFIIAYLIDIINFNKQSQNNCLSSAQMHTEVN